MPFGFFDQPPQFEDLPSDNRTYCEGTDPSYSGSSVNSCSRPNPLLTLAAASPAIAFVLVALILCYCVRKCRIPPRVVPAGSAPPLLSGVLERGPRRGQEGFILA